MHIAMNMGEEISSSLRVFGREVEGEPLGADAHAAFVECEGHGVLQTPQMI